MLQILSHGRGSSLLGEGPVQQPSDDGKIATLVEGREDNRVFVLGRHVIESFCEGVEESNV